MTGRAEPDINSWNRPVDLTGIYTPVKLGTKSTSACSNELTAAVSPVMRDGRSESSRVHRDQFDANYQSERRRQALVVRSLCLVDS